MIPPLDTPGNGDGSLGSPSSSHTGLRPSPAPARPASIRRLNGSLLQAQAHLALARHRFPNQQARLAVTTEP